MLHLTACHIALRDPHLLGKGGNVLARGAVLYATLQAPSQSRDPLEHRRRCILPEAQGRQRLSESHLGLMELLMLCKEALSSRSCDLICDQRQSGRLCSSNQLQLLINGGKVRTLQSAATYGLAAEPCGHASASNASCSASVSWPASWLLSSPLGRQACDHITMQRFASGLCSRRNSVK